jgi:translation elongation factor EF-Tu-like GTPase
MPEADAVVSEAVRRQILERQKREQEADAAPVMSGAQAAALKRELADILEPGETVTEALKRLRPPPQRATKKGAPLVRISHTQARSRFLCNACSQQGQCTAYI